MSRSNRYIPALRFDWLTPLYDPAIRWMFPEAKVKQQLLRQARIQPGQSVLDLGAGTGTLAIMIKQIQPEAEVTGLDGDPKVLFTARNKAAAAGVSIRWQEGLADRLPYPDASFDRVLSSLVFHHLDTGTKERSFREAWRVLQPGGELHLLDFGPPRTTTTRLTAHIMRHLERVADNIDDLLPGMMQMAGFVDVQEATSAHTILGALTLYQGRKPM